jgi:adenylyl cyclase-associated protein
VRLLTAHSPSLVTPWGQVYLSETSKGACVTTAKSSEVNVLVPGRGGGDLVEAALPEQFSSTFEHGKWVTVPVCHSGG